MIRKYLEKRRLIKHLKRNIETTHEEEYYYHIVPMPYAKHHTDSEIKKIYDNTISKIKVTPFVNEVIDEKLADALIRSSEKEPKKVELGNDIEKGTQEDIDKIFKEKGR